MSYTNQNKKAIQLQALEVAREYIENNQEIPNELSRVLFPPEKREYELTYWGKESENKFCHKPFPSRCKKIEFSRQMQQLILTNGLTN